MCGRLAKPGTRSPGTLSQEVARVENRVTEDGSQIQQETERAAHLPVEQTVQDNGADGPLRYTIARRIKSFGIFFLRDRALEALVNIGAPAVPQLIDALGDHDEDIRRCA